MINYITESSSIQIPVVESIVKHFPEITRLLDSRIHFCTEMYLAGIGFCQSVGSTKQLLAEMGKLVGHPLEHVADSDVVVGVCGELVADANEDNELHLLADLFVHELTHAHQILSGRLVLTTEYQVWEGVMWKPYATAEEYATSPWEQEAYGAQEAFIRKHGLCDIESSLVDEAVKAADDAGIASGDLFKSINEANGF